MNLSKKAVRGLLLIKYDPVNHLLFGQWNNNKVVSFISTLGISGTVTLTRRVRAQRVELPIEVSLKCYTADNIMGCVADVDKDQKIVEDLQGFIQEMVSYIGVLVVFDFMIVNGRVAWNMAATNNDVGMHHFLLSNWKFQLILSK